MNKFAASGKNSTEVINVKEKVNQLFKDKLVLVMLVLGLLTIVAAAGAVRIRRGSEKTEESPYLEIQDPERVIAEKEEADGKTPAAVISFPVKAQISSLPQGMGNSGLIFTGNMTTLRFGDVIRGLTAVKEVSFSNITSETVTVTAVSANDPYYPGSSFELPVSVAPGAQIKIPIEFRSHDLLPSGLIVEPVTVTTGTGSFSFNAEGSPIVSNEPLLVLTAGGESITEGSVYRFSEVAVNTKGTPETFRVT